MSRASAVATTPEVTMNLMVLGALFFGRQDPLNGPTDAFVAGLPPRRSASANPTGPAGRPALTGRM